MSHNTMLDFLPPIPRPNDPSVLYEAGLSVLNDAGRYIDDVATISKAKEELDSLLQFYFSGFPDEDVCNKMKTVLKPFSDILQEHKNQQGLQEDDIADSKDSNTITGLEIGV